MDVLKEMFRPLPPNVPLILLGAYVAVAIAWFVWNRVHALAWLARGRDIVLTLMLGAMAALGVLRSFAKYTNDPPRTVRSVGSRVPHDRSGGNMLGLITEEDVSNGWRVAYTADGAAFARPFDGVTTNGDWRLSGAHDDSMRINPAYWAFPWKDGTMCGITVLSWCEFMPNVMTNYFPAPFADKVSLVPECNWHQIPSNSVPYEGDAALTTNESVFWHGVTTNNSLVLTWQNAIYARDANSPTNFQAELFADGSFEYRYDDRTVGYSRVHPLDLDFDGLPNTIDPEPETPLAVSAWNQSGEWAVAVFPSNATEIASAGGYAAWVMQRAADQNRRLVGLQIASPGDRWPICVEVGGVPVMADGNTELLFATDCGAQVPFSLYDGRLGTVNVSYAVPSSNFQTFTLSNFQTSSFPHEWIVGDMTVHLDNPRMGWIRRIAEVSVVDQNLTHLFPGNSALLAAVVTNCHADAYLGCTWIGGAGISFSDAHSLTTTVTYASSDPVSWATNNVYLVTCYAGGYCVTNAEWFTVGVEAIPTPSLSIDCQEVFFLNDAEFIDYVSVYNRAERIRPVTLNLQAPCGTSGTLAISAQGSANPVVCHVENGVTNRVNSMTLLPISVTNSFACIGQYTVYVSCPQRGTGTLTATLMLDGGGTLTDTVSFKCIEPLRKLVTVEHADDGRIVNPSRLVMGTNAILKVGVKGDFAATNVDWRVVSGPGRITATNEWSVTVEPTGTNEDVVVEARFNNDEIQPSFVLPVVESRIIPVKAFIVKPPYRERRNQWKEEKIRLMFDTANEIYNQIGVRFDLVSTAELSLPSNNFWKLEVTHMEQDANGEKSETYTDEAWTLLNQYDSRDCIEMYFIGELVNANAVAIWSKYGILVSKEASGVTLAHELGHAFGLYDCFPMYQYRANGNYEMNYIPYYEDPVDCLTLIGKGDWGEESGRGFYEIGDTYGNILNQLLMYGYNVRTGYDIPDDKAYSLREGAQTPYETIHVDVGAETTQKDLMEVYSE